MLCHQMNEKLSKNICRIGHIFWSWCLGGHGWLARGHEICSHFASQSYMAESYTFSLSFLPLPSSSPLFSCLFSSPSSSGRCLGIGTMIQTWSTTLAPAVGVLKRWFWRWRSHRSCMPSVRTYVCVNMCYGGMRILTCVGLGAWRGGREGGGRGDQCNYFSERSFLCVAIRNAKGTITFEVSFYFELSVHSGYGLIV